MILSVETSTSSCSVALHEQGKLISSYQFHLDKSHSSLLPSIIDELLENSDFKKKDLQAVAISEGPGSYTGLRIGYSVVKGLCYSLDLPLVTVHTLDIMFNNFLSLADENVILIPMLDARRMEVYRKVVNVNREILEETSPLIIEEDSFDHYLNNELWLLGSGSTKCREVIKHPKFKVLDGVFPDAADMGVIAYEKFDKGDFADVAYSEPLYLKEFQTKKARNKLLE